MPVIAQNAVGTLSAVLGGVDWDAAPAPTVTVQSLAGVEQAGFPSTAIVHDGLGLYHYVWSVPAAQGIATYVVHFAGFVGGVAYDGWDTVEVVAAGTITIPTAAYASLADLKVYLRVPATADPSQDPLWQAALGAASRTIDRACLRSFIPASGTASARRFVPTWDETRRRVVIEIDDLMDSTGLIVEQDTAGDGSAWAAITGAYLAPLNNDVRERPWTQIVLPWGVPMADWDGSVRVTANWGWTAVPETIYTACLLQTARLVKRQDSPFGIAGSPEMGNVIRLLARLDPDVAVMVESYRRARPGIHSTSTAGTAI